MIYFTSDTHWGHLNIIEYCARPFKTLDGKPDVRAMTYELIRRWNQVVKPDDTVYHLGDFSFGNISFAQRVCENLAGTKYLVRGNHDRHTRASYIRAGFANVFNKHELMLNDKHLLLQHHPTACPPEFHYVLCGHIHEKWKRQDKTINVGVDVWDFFPVTLETLTMENT